MKNSILKSILLIYLCLIASSSVASKNTPAPDFTLKSYTNENLKLSEYRGEVIMINFWASWCGPCRQEMPLLDDLYKKYKPLGFTILGINVEENSKQAKALLKKIPVSFPILFDTRNKVSQLYDVSAMPTTILIDRDGNVRQLYHGYKPGYEQKYQQMVRSLVRE